MKIAEIHKEITLALIRHKEITLAPPEYCVLFVKDWLKLANEQEAKGIATVKQPTTHGLKVFTVPYKIKPSVVLNHE